MTVAESLLPEFDHEMGVTRKLLERVPESKASWKPHLKSRSLGDLAVHVSNIPSYLVMTIKQDTVDSATEFKRPPGFTTTKALLDFFDQNVRNGRQALLSAVQSDAEMTKSWTLRRGDQIIFSRPRADVLRSFVMSHHIHHRGQLTVYLRLQDVPLPSVYGPTADQV